MNKTIEDSIVEYAKGIIEAHESLGPKHNQDKKDMEKVMELHYLVANDPSYIEAMLVVVSSMCGRNDELAKIFMFMVTARRTAYKYCGF